MGLSSLTGKVVEDDEGEKVMGKVIEDDEGEKDIKKVSVKPR